MNKFINLFRSVEDIDGCESVETTEKLLSSRYLKNILHFDIKLTKKIAGSEDASKSSFPWKAERTDVPVLYTEENEEQEEEPKNKPSSGVKFSIGGGGDDEPEPEPEDDDAEHHRERGHRQNRHKSKVSKHDKSSSRRMSQDFVNLADESGELQEADLEEIAGHR